MLGQRLKEARIAAGLSQRQLCGEEITRNMLSQIESGKARPSMQTLPYLAQQLGKPISWFLEEQPAPDPEEGIPDKARKLYAEGEFRQCMELLEGKTDLNDEEAFLQILCLLTLGREAVAEQRHHYARSLLEKVGSLREQTIYYTPQLERERLLLMFESLPEQASELDRQLPQDHRELLLRAQARLLAGEYEACIHLLMAVPEQDAPWHYLRGQARMGQGQYDAAAEDFLLAEEAYPILCAKALESCYRELEDYKRAYQYACKQRTE